MYNHWQRTTEEDNGMKALAAHFSAGSVTAKAALGVAEAADEARARGK